MFVLIPIDPLYGMENHRSVKRSARPSMSGQRVKSTEGEEEDGPGCDVVMGDGITGFRSVKRKD